MKQLLLYISFVLIMPWINISIAQTGKGEYKYSVISFPSLQTMSTSFYVNETGQVFLPLNGGIYLPKDSVWFLPPSKEYSFTSFAPSLKDTSLFVFANTADHTELYYLKSTVGAAIKKYPMATLEKGLYNIIYKNNTCYVWGYSSGISKIGILLKDEIKWLMNIEGLIRQVQVNDSSEIFFAYKNSIYTLGNRQTVLTLDKTIYGFAFDKSNNLLLSCSDGIGIRNNDKLKIIATEVSGVMEYRNGSLFVLDRSRNTIVQITYE